VTAVTQTIDDEDEFKGFGDDDQAPEVADAQFDTLAPAKPVKEKKTKKEKAKKQETNEEKINPSELESNVFKALEEDAAEEGTDVSAW